MHHRYGRYRRTPESTAEARAWEEAKGDVRRVPVCYVDVNVLSNALQTHTASRGSCRIAHVARLALAEPCQFFTALRGLHFLAIQSDEDAEESSGLWLLQEQPQAPV